MDSLFWFKQTPLSTTTFSTTSSYGAGMYAAGGSVRYVLYDADKDAFFLVAAPKYRTPLWYWLWCSYPLFVAAGWFAQYGLEVALMEVLFWQRHLSGAIYLISSIPISRLYRKRLLTWMSQHIVCALTKEKVLTGGFIRTLQNVGSYTGGLLSGLVFFGITTFWFPNPICGILFWSLCTFVLILTLNAQYFQKRELHKRWIAEYYAGNR